MFLLQFLKLQWRFSFWITPSKNTLWRETNKTGRKIAAATAIHLERNGEVGISISTWNSSRLRSFHKLSWTLAPSVHVPLTVLVIWDCFFATPPFLPICSSTSSWLRIQLIFILQGQGSTTQNWTKTKEKEKKKTLFLLNTDQLKKNYSTREFCRD